MGRIINTMQLIDRAKGNINSRYDLCLKNAVDIEKERISEKEVLKILLDFLSHKNYYLIVVQKVGVIQ